MRLDVGSLHSHNVYFPVTTSVSIGLSFLFLQSFVTSHYLIPENSPSKLQYALLMSVRVPPLLIDMANH